MLNKKISIRNNPQRAMMLICCIVVLLTCSAFSACEFYFFRENSLQKLSTYGEMISNNSTAAIAFKNKEDAEEILNTLKAEPHIMAASIYDSKGCIFCGYTSAKNLTELPSKPGSNGYHFINSSLEGFRPIVQGNKQIGTLYLRSDLKAMHKRFEFYIVIAVVVMCFSLLLTYFLSESI